MSEPRHDPFDEARKAPYRRDFRILGCRVRFDSDSRPLLRLAEQAFAGLPAFRMPHATPALHVRLRRAPRGAAIPARGPAPLQLASGAGVLTGAMDADNFALIAPRERRALVSVSPSMLEFPYHVRYELIEFAVLTLISRSCDRVPLHAACVGTGGRGVLIIGESGAGKSTLAAHSALDGLEYLAEDSVFVDSRSGLATAVPAFLHLHRASLDSLGARVAARARRSPTIRRRSGAQKFEIDLRRGGYALTRQPLRIVAVVLLTAQAAGDRPLLQPMSGRAMIKRVCQLQPQATGHESYERFCASLARLPSFRMLRGRHPSENAGALSELLAADTLR